MTADKFETTFSVSAAPDVVWKRLDQRDEDGRWLLPAFEALGDELEVEPGAKLHVRKVTEPCAGSEIVIVLEHEGSGTKVTVSQSGFRAWFASATDAFAVGWRHIVADLALYLDRGVRGGRHARSWATARVLAPRDAGRSRSRGRHARLARGGDRPRAGRRRDRRRRRADRHAGRARIDDAHLRRAEIEVEWARGEQRLAAAGRSSGSALRQRRAVQLSARSV